MVAHSTIDHTGITGVGGTADLAGKELDYVQITAPVTVTGTTEATATTIITGTSQAYAAVLTLIEVFCPRLTVGAAANSSVIGMLYDGATVVGRLFLYNPKEASAISPIHAAYRLTPTAAAHQYIVKAWRQTGDGSWDAGVGGAGVELPSFLRITRVAS